MKKYAIVYDKNLIPAEQSEVSIVPVRDDTSIQDVISKYKPERIEAILSITEVPVDTFFRGHPYRNALKFNAGTFSFDIEKAKELHMGKIRVARDEKLEELDLQTLKGIDVQAEKQVLRDIPQNFDLSKAKTLEELSVLWPAELNKDNRV